LTGRRYNDHSMSAVRRSQTAATTTYQAGVDDAVELLAAARHGLTTSGSFSALASAGDRLDPMVTQSARTLSHPWINKPCVSKKARMREESQSTISSRMGTSTLKASSLRTVRLAISEMYRASETAMVKPSRWFTCSMTWMSELPSPT